VTSIVSRKSDGITKGWNHSILFRSGSEINVVPWYGYAVPRGTPQLVVDRIAAGFVEALRSPKVRELLEKQALEPMEAISLKQIAELYAADAEKYAKVVRESGMKRSD